MIKEKKGVVRSIDVARALNFSKPSVSRAMGLLRDQGFISMEQGGDIQLTEEGPYKGKIHLRASPSPDCFLQEVNRCFGGNGGGECLPYGTHPGSGSGRRDQQLYGKKKINIMICRA